MMSRRRRSMVCSVLLLLTAMQTRHTASSAGRASPTHDRDHAQLPLHAYSEAKKQSATAAAAAFLQRRGGEEGGGLKGRRTLGSRPPSCDHKCGGCRPCAAIQVPTTTAAHVSRLQYANYEPEGWKCKCGSSFYNP